MFSTPILALVITLIAIAAVGYLLGSISFAVIVTDKFKHVDVRDYGSKNAGMTNVSRVAGKKAAALTLIFDAAKGMVAVLLAKFAAVPILGAVTDGHYEKFDPIFFMWFAGISVVLGHIYPLFFKLRGGKGIATFLGVLLILDWRVALIALLCFLIVLGFTHIVSASSLTAAVSLPISMFFLYDGAAVYTAPIFGMSQHVLITICMALYGATAFYTHRSNIVRLIHGEEKKIGRKK